MLGLKCKYTYMYCMYIHRYKTYTCIYNISIQKTHQETRPFFTEPCHSSKTSPIPTLQTRSDETRLTCDILLNSHNSKFSNASIVSSNTKFCYRLICEKDITWFHCFNIETCLQLSTLSESIVQQAMLGSQCRRLWTDARNQQMTLHLRNDTPWCSNPASDCSAESTFN